MQKILAFLLLIGLINALGNGEGGVGVLSQNGDVIGVANVGAVKMTDNNKSGTERMILAESRGDEALKEETVEKFDACLKTAGDNEGKRTTCFFNAMEVFGKIGNKEEKSLTGLTEDIVRCKKEANTAKCLRNASEEKELEGDAQETIKFITEVVEANVKIEEFIKEQNAEFQKFLEKNYICEDEIITNEDGEEVTVKKCVPTEAYKKVLEELKAKNKAEFDRLFYTEEMEINGEKVTIYLPTKVALEEEIARMNKMVEELQKKLTGEVTKDEKEVFPEIIKAIEQDIEYLTEELQKPKETVVEELKKQIKAKIDSDAINKKDENVDAALKSNEKSSTKTQAL